MISVILHRIEQLEDGLKKLQNRKFPAGFYALGKEVTESGQMFATVIGWSTQALVMLEPGETRVFRNQPMNQTKFFTIHSWGLCRLIKAQLANEVFAPIDGALFLTVNRSLSPGCILEVTIQALDFEPLSEMKS
jgi:hypothetical protein